MLWMPWIKLLNMIPLVGWLLSGIASFAAFIWSAIVGFNTAIFVIAVAWVFFRPLVGICLLVTFALVIYLAFFFPWNEYFGDGEVKQEGGDVDDYDGLLTCQKLAKVDVVAADVGGAKL